MSKQPPRSLYPMPVFQPWESKELMPELQLVLTDDELELVWPAAFDASLLGSQLLDASTLPPTPVPGKNVLKVPFKQVTDAAAFIAQVQAVAPNAGFSWGFCSYYDLDKYYAQYQAIETKRLWVGPRLLETKAPKGKKKLRIDPQDVFGSRGHPTTTMILQFLEENPKLKGSSLYDVGTGTGVLAIGAALLGCGNAEGNDILPEAVEAAKTLARENKVKAKFTTADVTTVKKQFDIVVANIPTSAWPILAEATKRLVKRDLYVSGYPELRRAEHEAMFAPLELVSRKTIGQWASTHFRAPTAASSPATRGKRKSRR